MTDLEGRERQAICALEMMTLITFQTGSRERHRPSRPRRATAGFTTAGKAVAGKSVADWRLTEIDAGPEGRVCGVE